MTDEVFELALEAKGKYLTVDLKDLMEKLPKNIQSELRDNAVRWIEGDNIEGTKDDVSRVIDVVMLEYLRNATFERIKDGQATGGKSGDAENKLFIKILETKNRLIKDLVPTRTTAHVSYNLDEETSREVLLSSGKIEGKKIVDVKETEQ